MWDVPCQRLQSQHGQTRPDASIRSESSSVDVLHGAGHCGVPCGWGAAGSMPGGHQDGFGIPCEEHDGVHLEVKGRRI